MRHRQEFQQVDEMDVEDYGSQNDESKTNKPPVPTLFAVAVFAGFIGLYFVSYAIDEILPTPMKLSDESVYPEAFIAERAQHDLKLFTDLGQRVTGSYENEVLAVDLLRREISFIQQQAHANQTIEVDVQVVSGSYFLDFKPYGVINAYGNVQNVIVRLASRNNSAHSVLINAHFDSVPTSPGGSDDGINCAVMLEILRKLSRSPDPPEHNIIFLFNGAEETPLQAAHGFITQHRWAKEVKIVVNLEAAGAGGKIILFQAGPNRPWLMQYYNRVPHPYAQAAGEELFQSNVIPSDTDFRIFRDFGGTLGFDMAFFKTGYRYHTKYDDFENIPLGSFQHVGDNALSLVKSLANAPELHDLDNQSFGKVTFYDIFGWFMISYNQTLAIVLNLCVSIVSIFAFVKFFRDFELGVSKSTFKYIGIALGTTLIGWSAAAAFVLIEAIIIDAAGYSLSWYRHSWLIFGLYCTPVIACMCTSFIILNHFYEKGRLCINIQAQIQAHIARLIWTLVLLLGSFVGIRSVYALLIPILFHALAFILCYIFRIHQSAYLWQIVLLTGMIIPTLILCYQTNTVMALFVPLCGRIGSEKNPDLMIGLISVLFTILITSFCVPLITLVRKPLYFIGILAIMFLTFFIIVFTPLGFPYNGNRSSPTPQRFWVTHTSRVLRNETGDIFKSDSGFFITNLDRNSPKSVHPYVKEFKNMKSIADDCDVALFCGLPLVHTRAIAILKASTWIPAGKPIIHEPVRLTVNSKESVASTVMRYNVTATGPDHMLIYLSPTKEHKMANISLLDQLPKDVIKWNNRPTYVIVYTFGKEVTPLNFLFDIEIPKDVNSSNTSVEIALIGRYVQKRIIRSPQYQLFLEQFPDWVDMTAWVGAVESWII